LWTHIEEDINKKLDVEMKIKYNTLHKKIKALETATPSQSTNNKISFYNVLTVKLISSLIMMNLLNKGLKCNLHYKKKSSLIMMN
jgi:hypothetical protein